MEILDNNLENGIKCAERISPRKLAKFAVAMVANLNFAIHIHVRSGTLQSTLWPDSTLPSRYSQKRIEIQEMSTRCEPAIEKDKLSIIKVYLASVFLHLVRVG